LRKHNTTVNTVLTMEGEMNKLKQIGPRIREDVYDALHTFSHDSRMSMSLIVELALQDYLKAGGVDLNDNRD
jgi:hypothetical protein